jgi:hypothetical protein
MMDKRDRKRQQGPSSDKGLSQAEVERILAQDRQQQEQEPSAKKGDAKKEAVETGQKIDQGLTGFAEGAAKNDQSTQMEAADAADKAKQEVGKIAEAVDGESPAEEPVEPPSEPAEPEGEKPAEDSAEKAELKETKLLDGLLVEVTQLTKKMTEALTADGEEDPYVKEYKELATKSKERLNKVAGQEFGSEAEKETALNLIFKEYQDDMQAIAIRMSESADEEGEEGTEAGPPEEDAEEIESPEEDARAAYFAALRKRGDFVTRGKKAEF